MAVSNARLQAEVRARVRELAASRRRIVEAEERRTGGVWSRSCTLARKRISTASQTCSRTSKTTQREAAGDVARVVSELHVARAEAP